MNDKQSRMGVTEKQKKGGRKEGNEGEREGRWKALMKKVGEEEESNEGTVKGRKR